MKLIIGLGNPGRIYINSRHNIGFKVVKALAKKKKIPLKKDNQTFSISGKGRISGSETILAMPLTFMNLSGISVVALLKKYKIDINNLLIICDDLNLHLGRIKIRPAGSSGGHRGLKSIIENLKTSEFNRLRIGIGRPDEDMDKAEYVLSAFTRKEKGGLKDTIEKAEDCCELWVRQGIEKSMDVFNQRQC